MGTERGSWCEYPTLHGMFTLCMACMPRTAWARAGYSSEFGPSITRSDHASQIGHDLAHQLGSLTRRLPDLYAGGLQRLLLGGGGSG